MVQYDSKWLGGILLVAGTSIGGAMLALPVATAPGGFIASSVFFVLCWALMTFCAFLILEVNLWLPEDSNLISMAKVTLGRTGEIVAWVTYLFLLYTLLSAYIAAGADLFQNLLEFFQFKIPLNVSAALITLLLALIVSRGIAVVDYMNRGLMFAKLGALGLLILILAPHVSLSHLQGGAAVRLVASVMVIITSFGFAIIIPSLRTYFRGDVKKLRSAIFVGTLMPLIVYIGWIAVVMGVLPTVGENSLLSMFHAGHETSALTISLSVSTQNLWIESLSHFFTSICILTAFMGVSLCLVDFFSDGLGLSKNGKEGLGVLAITFLPPLIIILFQPDIFMQALSYAGIWVIVLLILLPVLMTWVGRYHKNLSEGYQVVGGKISLCLAFIAAIALLLTV